MQFLNASDETVTQQLGHTIEEQIASRDVPPD
jgi:hypothetical protein